MASKKKPLETVCLEWAFSLTCPHCSEVNFITSIFMEDGSNLGTVYIPDVIKCGSCKNKLQTDYPPGVKNVDKKEEEKGETKDDV